MENNKQTGDNSDTGSEPEAATIVERASSIAQRLEESEKRIDEKLKQLQDLEAKRILGGKSVAGQPEVKKEETPQEYAKRILSGKL